MKCFFESCNEASAHAISEHSFGVYFSDKENQNRDMHVHDCCEIFLCLEGRSSFLIDNKVYDINNGDLFVINQFEAHKVSVDVEGRFLRYIMHVHPIFVYSNSFGSADLADCFYGDGKIAKVSLDHNETESLTSLFESMRKTAEYGDDLYKKLKATELLLEVNKYFKKYKGNVSRDTEGGEKALRLAIEYINENFRSELSLEEIAKNSFVSAGQLCKLFNKYCDTTVSKYIISKRITEAKKLLVSGKNVTETAYTCGFNNYAHFIKTFKSIVGVPPGKYKASMEI